ncbi:MAG: extracellular solute-binding protein [Oscillospiraceae bacterium]|nr:extracellular solute-binding protein [Oscillospiraceae bacterium]
MNAGIKHKTKFFLALVAFFMLFAIYSCNTNEDSTENTKENAPAEANAEKETEPEIPDNLPEMDFGGYDFRLYLDESQQKDMYIEEEVGEIVDDAVYKRNRRVEDRFNINITAVLHPAEWSSGMDGSKAIKAGDDAFDLMMTHGRIAYQYAGQNMLIDWLENMPFTDLKAVWWNQDVNGDSTMFGKLYCPAGDISYRGLRTTFCMIFNKNLFQALGLDYPYDDVAKGSWTLEKFTSIAKNGTADLNGDGIMSPESDRYGLESGNVWCWPTCILYCGGDRVIKKGEDGLPELAMYNERTIDIFDKFFDMANSGAMCIGDEKTAPWGNPDKIAVFKDGRALFKNAGMGDIVALRDMEQEIGLIPIPKYDEETPKYYGLVEAYGGLLSVPVTVSDLERTSIITEALCAEGYKIIIPAYYEKALKTKYARDDESEEMLDYIKDSAVYDYGYMNHTLAGDLSSIGATLVQTNNPNFTSLYDKNLSKAQKNIEKFIEKMEDLD